MTSERPTRKRGVVLTPTGRRKLQEAIKAWEEQDNFGEKLTIEELSDRTKLDAGTVAKVLDCEEGVDRRTLERFFQAFNLELTQEDYSKPIPSGERRPTKNTRIDWGEAVDVSIFYGRTVELETLDRWIVSDRCRLIALLGMGGIGKTSLAAKLGEKVQHEFDYVVWRSLREAPPLKEILTSLIQFLSNQQETEADLPESLGGRITKLLEYLRTQRCLVILDNAESILQEGQAGVYREGYEGYGELLKRVGESSHQSCLLVTSREKPRELSAIEGEAFPVRSLQLRGVEGAEGQEILKAKGLNLSETSEGAELIHRCAGNPLALKLVATTIQDLFDGDIGEFLNQETIAFEGVRDLLDQHFDRLSELEKSVMYWLAINREPVSVQELQEDIVPPVTKPRLLEALKGLVGRSLIEKGTANFTQQPVVMEYMTEQLIEKICEEIRTDKNLILNSYALIKATSKDYIRETQIRLILKPIINKLYVTFCSKDRFEEQIKLILKNIRKDSPLQESYAGGNILNLLCQQKFDLSVYDFSEIRIWQAYLQGVNLRCTNFARADLTKSVINQELGQICSIAYSPDGRLLAIGEANGRIRLWQVLDTQLLLTLQGHTAPVWSVVFDPKGQMLVSGSYDRTIKLWQINTGECIRTLQGHTDRISSIAISPDGCILVSGSNDRTMKVWLVNTGKCIKTLRGHTSRVLSVAFSPDGQMLASSGYEQISFWKVSTGQPIKTFKGHTGCVRSIAFNLDGSMLVSGGDDHLVKLWQISTEQCIRTFRGCTNWVLSVAFSSDGHIITAGSRDQTVRLWNVSTGECLRTCFGHTTWVSSVAFSPDGQLLASGSEDQVAKLWKVSTGQCIKTLQGYCNSINAVTFSPDGQLLASGSDDLTLSLWQVELGQCIKTLQGHTGSVASVAFSPNGKLIASGSHDQTARLWKVNTGECIKILRGHTDFLQSVAFSPDGQLIASAGDDQMIKFWQISTGTCLHSIQAHEYRAYSVTFSPNGELLASSGAEHVIKLWRVSTGECIQTLHGSRNWITSVAFSPDGQLLASSSGDDAKVRIWQLVTGQCVGTFQGHTNWIVTITFSPDGQLIASGSDDHTIKLWQVSTGHCIKTLLGHENRVRSVAFDPAGQRLASGSTDGMIKLWNIETTECFKTLQLPKPYEGMKIAGVTGLTEEQKASLIALGAIESE